MAGPSSLVIRDIFESESDLGQPFGLDFLKTTPFFKDKLSNWISGVPEDFDQQEADQELEEDALKHRMTGTAATQIEPSAVYGTASNRSTTAGTVFAL